MKNLILLVVCSIGMHFSAQAQLPAFQWAKINFGGTNDGANEIAVDKMKNVIEIGSYTGEPFNLQGNLLPQTPATSNPGTHPGRHQTDGYIIKYDSIGTVLWYHRLHGTYADHITGVTTDTNNNIYVTGYSFSDTTFISGIPFPQSPDEQFNGFVIKMTPNGNISWIKNIAALTGTYPNVNFKGVVIGNIECDLQGNAYVAGQMRAQSLTFANSTITVTPNTTTGSGMQPETFIVKFDGSGNEVWITGIQGTLSEEHSKLTVDRKGNVYINGETQSPVIITKNASYTTGAPNIVYNPTFTAKFDSAGNSKWISFSYWEDSTVTGNQIFVKEAEADAKGNVYIFGSLATFQATNIISFGNSNFTYVRPTTNPSSYYKNAFVVAKYDSLGQEQWLKLTGVNGGAGKGGFEIDGNGCLYFGGTVFTNADFDGFIITNPEFYDIGASGPYEGFIAKMNDTGAIVWARNMGVTYSQSMSDLEIDNTGNIYVSGSYKHDSLLIDGQVYTGNYPQNNFSDAYIMKFENTVNNCTVQQPPTNIPTGMKVNPAIYPNPVTDRLYVDLPGEGIATICIYDILGRRVTVPVVQDNSIMVRGMPEGVYIIEIVTKGNKIYKSKFVKRTY